MNGYNHVYQYDMSGKLMNQITKGPGGNELLRC